MGNGGDGVRIQGDNSTVQGNWIGVTRSGSPLGNGGDGVVLTGGTTQNSLIGGTGAGVANTIAYNGGAGVAVLTGNGHQIRRNSIANNTGLGIDIGPGADDGVTANDVGDGDTGTNNRQNFPVLSSVTGGAPGVITGRLDSGVGIYNIEFYRVTTCHSSGNGQGLTYIGTLDTPANTDFTLNTALTVGDIITATATDAAGNTSEFSTCTTTAGPPAVIDPGACFL